MENWLIRTEKLIGKNSITTLKNTHIIICGIGGVGSYSFEALIRAGVSNITIIDNDIVDITNINRQSIATTSTIGRPKVEVARDRALDINPNINIIIHQEFLNDTNIDNLINKSATYVIDCIDSVQSKLDLIKYCKTNNINIISSMGTGNKLDPTKFKITDIEKTHTCPLAKKIRTELNKSNIKKLKVLFSEEIPKKVEGSPASISFVPSTAGLILAGYVVNELI